MSEYSKMNLVQAKELLSARDVSIEKLNKEKVALQSSIALLQEEKSNGLAACEKYKGQLEDKDSVIESLRRNLSDCQVQISALTNQNSMYRKQVQEQVETIENLKAEPTTAYRNEFVDLQKKYISLSNEKVSMDLEFAKLKKEHLDLQYDFADVQKSEEMFKANFAETSKNLEEAKRANEVYKETVGKAFSPIDLSGYLNKTIADFNKNSEYEESPAKYIINSMDIDLHAQVFHDENNELMFSAPNFENMTDNSLSSIKISIRAIPK